MDHQPNADRTISPVAGQYGWLRSAMGKKVGITAATLGASVFIIAGIYSGINEKGIPTKPADIGTSTISQQVADPPEPVAPPAPKPQPHVDTTAPAVVAAAAPAVVANAPPVTNYVVFPTSGGMASFGVLPSDKAENTTGGNRENGVAPPGNSLSGGAAVTQVAFKAATLPGSKAGPAMRLTYMLMPQPIPCRLDVALESTLAGPLFCSLTDDVLSPDRVVLMKSGSHVTGTYKNEVKEGQHRIFAMSGVGYTPEGIPVPLEVIMADALGRNGIAGDYDAHILERFGAAGALTAFQSAMSLAQASLSSRNSGNNTYLNFNGGGGGGVDQLATEILHNQINIPPTISVPPGTVVNLMIDKPIDFSDALHVEAR